MFVGAKVGKNFGMWKAQCVFLFGNYRRLVLPVSKKVVTLHSLW